LHRFVDWSETMLTLQVKGMTCNHCAKAVTQAVKEIDPGAEVNVDLPSGRVEVETSAASAAVAGAVTEAGYEVLSAA
jgi:copper chaperone